MIQADVLPMTLYFLSELMCTYCLQQAYTCMRWSAYGLFYIICIFAVSYDDVLRMLEAYVSV